MKTIDLRHFAAATSQWEVGPVSVDPSASDPICFDDGYVAAANQQINDLVSMLPSGHSSEPWTGFYGSAEGLRHIDLIIEMRDLGRCIVGKIMEPGESVLVVFPQSRSFHGDAVWPQLAECLPSPLKLCLKDRIDEDGIARGGNVAFVMHPGMKPESDPHRLLNNQFVVLRAALRWAEKRDSGRKTGS
jgi:hypothetical protein